MVRKNSETIIKAKIRRYLRQAADWHKIDNGMPYFYDLPEEKYKYAKRVKGNARLNQPYYVKSSRAIEEIAEKIYKLIKK